MRRWIAFAALLLVAGCSTLGTPGKRHTPAEIAGYRPQQFSTPVASQAGTEQARRQALAQLERADAGLADEATIAAALRAVAFYDTGYDAGRRVLRAVLADRERPLPQRPVEFQRAVLTAAFTFDAEGSTPLIAAVLERLATPREFAIAAYTLARADAGPAQRDRLRAALAARADTADPRLVALARALDDAGAPAVPPLPALLAAPLKPGLPVVFSLQRRDRRHTGLALVRGADGRFVRRADGQLFAVPHLALALSGLPGTVTLGNTPQGLFTVVGAGTAENPWIGPVPFLESKVPVEASVAEFTHDAGAAGPWSVAVYDALLPPPWRAYAPFHEAWLAGLAGRDEMLLHGSAVDPAPYAARPWWPGTPTDGCITAHEFWSPEGRLVASDQLELVRAFTRDGRDRGFLVVVEIDDAPRDVTLADVAPLLAAAESALLTAR